MRKGGLLDGFPLYLLADSESNAATVIIDSPELGCLQMSTVPENNRMIIVLCEDWQGLGKTREALRGLGREKISFILANSKRLPFRDKSMGGIVRLSSWIGKTGRRVSEKGRLSTILEEIERILKQNGCTIEILPKPIWRANRSEDKHLGYPEIQRYYVRPSFGPEYFVTKEWTPSPWPFKFLQLGRLTSIRIGVDLLVSRMRIRPLYNSISIFVRSKTQGRRLLERWNGNIAPEGKDCSNRPSQSAFGLYVKSNWNTLFFGYGENSEIVKFPLSFSAEASLKRNAENIEALYAEGNAVVRSVLPKIMDQGYVSGQAYWTEELSKGVSSAKWQWVPHWKRKVSESGFRLLMNLHRSSSQLVKINRDLFNHLLSPHIAIVEEEVRKLDPTFYLKPLLEALWRDFQDRLVPLVRTHGDFWPGNIIVSDTGELKGVLDWDTSMQKGWPLIDLFHLIVYQKKRRANRHFGSVVTGKLMPGRLSKWDHMVVQKYFSSISIERRLWVDFVAIYWIERVSQWIQTDCNSEGHDFKWLRRNVIKPLPQILEEVATLKPKRYRI